MPELNKDVIGKEYPPFEMKTNTHDSIYYALATNDPNPWYINGKREGGTIVPPMFAVRYGSGCMASVFTDGTLGSDFYKFLLHGEQKMEWFKVVRPGQKLSSTGEILSIEDKGSGELLTLQITTSLAEGGEIVSRQTFGLFIRTYGKMEKKPSAPAPEEDKSDIAFEAVEKVLPGQSYAYAEASGDHNPIHKDDDFAKKVGLGGIILHGLCSMALCHKMIVQNLCGGDPTKLSKYSVRFSKPVKPEDEIRIKAWWTEKDKKVGFEVSTQNGDIVIKNGVAELGEVSL